MEEQKELVTGLELASDRKEAEYDILQALLTASNYTEDENCVTEIEMRRNGNKLFDIHIHPVSDNHLKTARKKATTYMANPNNKKLPPIEKEVDWPKLRSWVIYLATTEEDQKRIWGNPAFMKAKGLNEPWESVSTILTAGEKNALFEQVAKISGLDEDLEPIEEQMDEEEYAKN